MAEDYSLREVEASLAPTGMLREGLPRLSTFSPALGDIKAKLVSENFPPNVCFVPFPHLKQRSALRYWPAEVLVTRQIAELPGRAQPCGSSLYPSLACVPLAEPPG